MHIEDYFSQIRETIQKSTSLILKEISVHGNPTFDTRTDTAGVIDLRLVFVNKSYLDVVEFVVIVNNKPEKVKYAYHYQSSENSPIFRYDNEPHWQQIPTFPNHKHDFKDNPEEPGAILPATKVSLVTVLEEISTIMEG